MVEKPYYERNPHQNKRTKREKKRNQTDEGEANWAIRSFLIFDRSKTSWAFILRSGHIREWFVKVWIYNNEAIDFQCFGKFRAPLKQHIDVSRLVHRDIATDLSYETRFPSKTLARFLSYMQQWSSFNLSLRDAALDLKSAISTETLPLTIHLEHLH